MVNVSFCSGGRQLPLPGGRQDAAIVRPRGRFDRMALDSTEVLCVDVGELMWVVPGCWQGMLGALGLLQKLGYWGQAISV